MGKFSNKNWLAVCLFLVFAATVGFFFADQVRAALTCSVVSSPTTCADVTLLKMSSTTNAHAGLPASSAYTNLVCCADVTAGLSNNCSGTFAPVGTLSGTNNAHYEDWTKTNYSSPANDFCLSVTSGTITVSTSTDCGSDITVFSFSGTSGTNAHVGGANAYATKICATTTAAAVVSLTVSPTSTAYSAMDISSVKKADTANTNDEFIITNTGNVAETFDIISTDATGGITWALSTSTVATNQYMHAYSALKTLTASTTLGSLGEQATKWVAMDKGTSYRTLKTNVATSTAADLVLELLTPSSVGDYVQKTITVTVRATEYP